MSAVLAPEPVEPEPVAEPVQATRARPRPPSPSGFRWRPAAARPQPPPGVPPDEPIWDRRHKRYVLWHSKAGRWLTHSDDGWAPLAADDKADASPAD